MKLAILGARGIPARYGGFETFAEKLSTGLAGRGIDVTVYCEDIPIRQATYEGVKLEYLGIPRLGPLSTIVFDVKCLWHARNRYDVVYMLGYGAAFFCFVPRIWGKQVWLNMDGIEWARTKWSRLAKFWLRSMEAVAMRAPSRVIADAEGIRDILESRYRRRPPISVIPYGAHLSEIPPDHGPLAEWGLTPGAYYLVVCRLEPENHVLEILRGYAQSRTGLPLIIVGDHEADTPYVRKLNGMDDARIRFIGTVYDQNMLGTLRYYCRAYFHGHSVGGTNPSLLEAMGCGNAIIAHDNPFNREVAGSCALYFKSESDIPVLLDEMASWGSETRQSVSSAARQRIRECYSWDSIVERYRKLMEAV